jgi:hypothetical protein
VLTTSTYTTTAATLLLLLLLLQHKHRVQQAFTAKGSSYHKTRSFLQEVRHGPPTELATRCRAAKLTINASARPPKRMPARKCALLEAELAWAARRELAAQESSDAALARKLNEVRVCVL